MGIIGTILIVLFVLVCLFLILFVLLQDDQGEGVGGLFGGGASSPFNAVTSNPLVKITGILGTVFMVCSLLVAVIIKTPNSSDVVSEAMQMNAEQNGDTEWWNAEASVETTEGDSLVIPEK